jgi:hypothetical protein
VSNVDKFLIFRDIFAALGGEIGHAALIGQGASLFPLLFRYMPPSSTKLQVALERCAAHRSLATESDDEVAAGGVLCAARRRFGGAVGFELPSTSDMGHAAPHEIRGWTRSGWRARAGRGVGAAFAVALCLAFDPLGSVGVYGGEVMDVDPSAPKVFEMNMTNPFHPTQSLSFAHVLFLGFSLTYADSAGLRGYIAQDLVQLGRYYAKTKFGCIRHCASADFDGIDGILGLGMPDAALASIPEPLLFAISDETGDPANQYILNRRIFTIVSTDEAAELHLGGFDPHSAVGPMTFVKTTSQAEYSVPVTSIRMGGTEVLNFGSAAQAAGRSDLPGILDSGTSCLVLPDTTLNGQLEQAPYTKLMSVMQRGEPLYVTIGGQQFEIPFSSWWLYPNDRPCIQRTPAGFQGILLGDVLFRSLAVRARAHVRDPARTCTLACADQTERT